MSEYAFRTDLQVRDYECDLQGVVNNAVYQNYLEHARHEFLRSLGIDFADLVRRKVFLVVTRAELDFRSPLRSGERFWVGTDWKRHSRVRFIFRQDIFGLPGDRLVMNAAITGTALNEKGKPFLPPGFGDVGGQK